MTFAHTHAHRHDPDTAVQAAHAAKHIAEQHKDIIATILLFHGSLTSQEISDRCELDYWQVARRISDLKRDGKVVDTGQRRASPGGRQACVWAVT